MKKVRLYGRPGCCLCDEAKLMIEELASAGALIDLAVINIETDPELHARYLERIPVIEVNGKIVSELEPRPDALRASLDTVGT